MVEQIKKILIVEDDEFLSSLYKELLTEEGYNVDLMKDGQTGLDAAKKGGYDLILLDIMLPKMDGLQVLKTLEESNNEKNGPIVMLTNLGQDSIVRDALKNGASGFLIKSSMTPDQVLHEVRVFLNKE
ncbi:hypothetical protein A2X44_01740 [candidate division CPR3 bacterium GWF2_35_18]|uniref:Response regulatory domain-containing protein n=1 Tax=candidate division CPR3 bacterium GW2011_GWF2_35_18 TaxID=1618350 RepID=A0A0G0ERF8_UNCC3|nr:MAG: hypothetical protein UR67_C0002G0032 [candidate division CPR3 bacterium GW2011_GWF2_35_18]OGB62722.1 MAG: hypothetical protein A2X44_01740 [candidate division CPR3 bacterium GWF2_35_18]OGB65748.1 MAG: hypothetical protein A2250_02000 [candidate division CPR3 bacterium RIFOXYA2_FULL_35_13]OGB76445.1 MAG: hypothetical protein A2476_03300 [candidate division CPR3 bacterium RIFOXYC2_FULL_35_7]OGB79041.1 MAG: hypothetical protein A2296_02445 [candidate division CPR3 bacterium RIFOXYB2_FULL_3